MFKKFLTFIAIFSLFLGNICESAFARAGGRSSFGGGRSSTSYFNQGSRGSRTYDSGGSNGKNYAPMQKSNTAPKQVAPNNAQNNASGNQPQQPTAPSFFQRNPMLSTFGAVLAGSWLGHMIWGNSGHGVAGENAGNGGGFLGTLIMMVLGAFAVIMLVKFLNRHSKTPPFNAAYNQQNNSNNNIPTQIFNIDLPESEKQKFAEILVEVQNAWSDQDFEKLKKLTTPEMLKYFSDSLSQNTSQNIANKIEKVEVTSVNISESWKEDEMEYATAILEWSALDYMVNLDKQSADADFIVEGNDKSLVISSEAWTFARYNSGGKWILSAIAQVE